MDNYSVRSKRLADFFLLPIFFLAMLAFNAFFPDLGFKSFAFLTFALVIVLVAFIPLKWGIIFTFTYIGLEGFLKVVSNYHPVIHVGSDILVIFLCIKAMVESFGRSDGMAAELPPLFVLFVLHFAWILVVLFNPYGLSLVASLAGAKIYVTMLMLFFFGFIETRSIKDAQHFMLPLILVALVHTGFGIYQGFMGEQSVLAIHPRYAVQLAKYQDTAFRPFGLTNVPGGPAVYLAFVVPLVLYFIFVTKNLIVRWFLIAYMPAAILLFLLCQVRSSLLKMIVGSVIFLIGAFIHLSRHSRRLGTTLVFMTLAIGATVYALPQIVSFSIEQNESNEDAVDRSLSLFDIDRVSQSRRGAWDRFVKYAQEAPFGAGFSRVGASAGKFEAEHRNDPFYGSSYFFADNFWVACVVEIGIPGMIIMTMILFFIFIKSWSAVKQVTDYERRLLSLSIFGSLVGIFIGLYGAEGVLYNPDSSFFWFFSGMLLKIPQLKESNNHFN